MRDPGNETVVRCGAHIPAFFGHVTLSRLFLSRCCKSKIEARRHNYRIVNTECKLKNMNGGMIETEIGHRIEAK